MVRSRMLPTVAMLSGLAYSSWIRPWHLSWGATTEEATGPMPGDELLPAPTMVATRAVTVGAEPVRVWPWLVQMGQGRGGLYSYDSLENLFRLDIHTSDRIVPEWQHLEVGERIMLSPERFSLVARTVDPPAALVFEFADGGWTWAFSSRSMPDGSTRLVVRNRWSSSHHGQVWKLAMWVIEPVAFVMEQRMLRSIASLAERGELPAMP